jgi:hypothetical protein
MHVAETVGNLEGVWTGHLNVEQHNVGFQSADLLDQSLGRGQRRDAPDGRI